MEVAESAKNLLEKRDAYLEACFDWLDTCLGAGDYEDELCALESIMKKIDADRKTEKSGK